jgi:hypothetical protein
MRITPTFLFAFAALALVPTLASAQRVPFFSPSGTAVDPEISVVNSGEILDAQAVVSGDMKHVTINARASSTKLLALRDFTFVGAGVRGGQGLVGGAGRGGGGGVAGANGAPGRGRDRDNGPAGDGRPDRRDRDALDDAGQDESPADSPGRATRAAQGAGVLDRPGMTMVARFRD